MKSGTFTRSRERGAALVELAIALPLLAVILVGTIDFGRAFRLAMVVTSAARAGAQYGAQAVYNSGDGAGMQNAALTVLSNNGVTAGAAATATRQCYCVNGNGTSGWTPLGSCPTAPPPATPCPVSQHLVVTVTVNAQGTFSLTTPFPGLPTGFTISRQATARVQ